MILELQSVKLVSGEKNDLYSKMKSFQIQKWNGGNGNYWETKIQQKME